MELPHIVTYRLLLILAVLPSLPFFFSDFRHDRWDPVEAFTRLEGPAASFDEEEVRRLRSVRRYASVLQPNTFPHSSARRRPGEGNWKPGRYLAPARIRHRDAQQSAHLPAGPAVRAPNLVAQVFRHYRRVFDHRARE